MRWLYLFVIFSLTACANQDGTRVGQANGWMDTPVRRPAELPACPPRSKAWCAAGPQDLSCSGVADGSFQTQLSGLLR